MFHPTPSTRVQPFNSFFSGQENFSSEANASLPSTAIPPQSKHMPQEESGSLDQIPFIPEELAFLLNFRSADWMPTYAALFSLHSFIPENFAFIFKHEADMRQAIAAAEFAPWIPKQTLSEAKELYKTVILRLLSKAKVLLINQKAHLTIHTAAQMGRSLHAGIKAVIKLIKEGRVIEANGDSTQDVFILPEEKVVFKLSNARARSEGNLLQSLFQIYTKNGLIPSAGLKQTNWKRWGAELISFDQKQVGYSDRELQSDPRLAAELLSWPEADCLKVYFSWRSLQDFSSSPRSWKEWLDKQPWGSQLLAQMWNCQIGGHPQSVSLETLRGFYQCGRLDESDKVTELGQSIGSLIQNDSIFGKSLTYSSPKKDEPFFVPVFPDSFAKQAYQKCQSRYWSYKAGDIAENGLFKRMQTHFLQKTSVDEAFPHPLNSARPQSPISQEEFTVASQASWKLIMPELFGYISSAEDEEILEETALDDIQVQPYIEGMRLLSSLHTQSQLLKAILERLGPKEQLKAVLTALFQMLDLHKDNIGLAPQNSDQVKAFRKKTFSVLDFSNQKLEFLNSNPFTFDELHEAYLMGNVHEHSIICVDGRAQFLSHLPELRSALETPWEWVLFDHDLCLAESNCWQTIWRKERLWTIFPLRSAFLSMDYKDIPLMDATLAELEDSPERDRMAYEDIGRRYAPIRRRLSSGIQKQLDDLLDYLLRQDCYSLTAARQADREGLIATIQENFARDLAEIKDPIHQAIWKLIEEDLSFAFVYPEDTYETLARRHRQDAGLLRALNSNLPLIPKQKIKIAYSLSSPDKFNERLKIAKQLFPKMTWHQQQALKERQQRMKAYLRAYRQLCQANPNPSQVLEQLKIFIMSSLFSSPDQQKYSALLQNNYAVFLQQPALLEEFKGLIMQECRPTLFTVMKAMYRHLADTDLLTRLWAENKPTAKHVDLIGHYNFPLEKIIRDVQHAYPVQSPIYQLSLKVNQAILAEKKPYFFFDFEDERSEEKEN